MRNQLVRQLLAFGVDAIQFPFSNLPSASLQKVLAALRLGGASLADRGDNPAGSGQDVGGEPSDSWALRAALQIPQMRSALENTNGPGAIPSLRTFAAGGSSGSPPLTFDESVDLDLHGLMADPWVRRAARHIPQLRQLVDEFERTGPVLSGRAFSSRYVESDHPRDEKGQWADKAHTGKALPASRSGGHLVSSTAGGPATENGERAEPQIAGGFGSYGKDHPPAAAARANELKQRVGQWWQSQTPGEREVKNKWLNGPELLRHYVRDEELDTWPGTTLREKFDHAAKAHPELVAGLQMRALEDGVAVWEDRQRKKALEAFNASLPKREWTPPDKHLFYEFVKPAIDGVVTSDIAMLQLAGMSWDQLRSNDPYAREMIGKVKAEYDFARKNGANDGEARQYAFYMFSAATRWHAEMDEVEEGVSRHAEDYGRKLSPAERILKLTGAVLDLVTVVSSGSVLATETGAALKPLGIEAKAQLAAGGKAAAKVRKRALAKSAAGELPESPKVLPDKLPDNVVFYTRREGDKVFEHLNKNVDGFAENTPAIWVRKDGKIYIDKQRWDRMTAGQKATAYFEEEGHMLRDLARSAAGAAKNDVRYFRKGIYTAVEEYHARLHAGVTKQQALEYALRFLTAKGIMKDVFEAAALYGLPVAPFIYIYYREMANRRKAEKK